MKLILNKKIIKIRMRLSIPRNFKPVTVYHSSYSIRVWCEFEELTGKNWKQGFLISDLTKEWFKLL